MTTSGLIIVVCSIVMAIAGLISPGITASGCVLVSACSAIGIWDGFAVGRYGVKFSVSEWVQSRMIAHPTLILACGILLGHWFAAL